MIKLKSLFRRGQGTSSSHSSNSSHKQQQNSSNNNRQKSQSSTSLNTAHEQQQQQQQHSITAATTKFYAHQETATYERGVDVGDEGALLLTNQQQEQRRQQLQQQQHQKPQSNTLPQKKSKLKGQKQPKLLPVQQPHSNAPEPHDPQQPLMTSLAAVPQASATGSSSNSNINNNNALAALQDGGAAAAAAADFYQQLAAAATATATATSANGSNTSADSPVSSFPAAAAAVAVAAVAASSYQQQQQQQQQLLNNEQQQQQLLEANNKMQELHKQMDRFRSEQMQLETRITELLPYQSEVAKLKGDLVKMQSLQEKSQMEIGNLKYENESLRNRLRDVVNSPLSDAEKHQIIQDSQRLHSSAPASIALPSTHDAHDGTPCLTPDWDKQSSSSEISVACLQDKIIQMEETHYSTNEELQATLQELADLQTQLTDTQTENERLAEEKDVLFQSLCRQTEKLNESRTQISTLQELLLRDTKQPAPEVSASEREQKLLDLIKTSQEEREAVLLKREELGAELAEMKQAREAGQLELQRQRERIALLDSQLDAANAERRQGEAQFSQAMEEISQRAIEISRLSTLLENARSKIEELEADLSRGDKTDLSEVLDVARKEKDALEERVAELQDQCSRSQAELRRLRDQLSGLTEECKVVKNNAKCAVSHLEYRLEQLQRDKDKIAGEWQALEERVAELQVQCKCHQEDKAQLQSLLAETQRHLGDVQLKLGEAECRLEQETQLRRKEAEEWQQFQADLLMTVRVANDFKTEALSAREQLVLDNKTQKEKIRLLEQQLEKLSNQQMQQSETPQSVLSTVQREMEMATRRSKLSFSRQDSRLSVKTLIESIENNKAQGKTDESESHYSSTSSLNSGTPDLGTTPIIFPPSSDWHESIRLPVLQSSNLHVNVGNQAGAGQGTNTSSGSGGDLASTTKATLPLRDQQQLAMTSTQTQIQNVSQPSTPATPSSAGSTSSGGLPFGNVSKSFISGERKDPLNMLAKNGGSKRNALLKWCQNKTVGYRNIDITNFSSSWNDGLAFCAILHSYLPDRIPYDQLTPANKRRNFSLAFAAAESVGIGTTLNINDMCQIERPDWMQVMSYVTAVYKYFET
ncbi:cytospin-A isoform X1 [Drosophila mauritiana]|uniref:Cytospin-A isoform X1 n=2 Tax=Drosophila mauritiana TaxID=7226 RepID=A0A6P8KQP1_DROMA|nr:cytospin-A isoform X1 [Drosophila mauritiana]XP_033172455.1 cytospin-A isoform X1 [Drosophila mauritiana]XP_033172456.1 cytospin-A isoform X1 [Drosophila mauritiana]XP_033172457.1 cytospin-A isoform X1 [Drosophila mauritiana]